MGTHMKTTIDIADSLLAEAKLLAAQRHSTLRAVVEEGLEWVLQTSTNGREAFHLSDASVDGHGAYRWQDWTDDQRTEAMYGTIPS